MNIVTAFLVAFLTFFPMLASAQSAPARDYLNTLVNQTRFFLDFLGSSGETAAESDLFLPNTESVSRLGSASLLWSFPLGDRYGGVALSENYATVKVKGPHGSTETSGFGDPAFTFHANIFGAPALTIEQGLTELATTPAEYATRNSLHTVLMCYDSDGTLVSQTEAQ